MDNGQRVSSPLSGVHAHARISKANKLYGENHCVRRLVTVDPTDVCIAQRSFFTLGHSPSGCWRRTTHPLIFALDSSAELLSTSDRCGTNALSWPVSYRYWRCVKRQDGSGPKLRGRRGALVCSGTGNAAQVPPEQAHRSSNGEFRSYQRSTLPNARKRVRDGPCAAWQVESGVVCLFTGPRLRFPSFEAALATLSVPGLQRHCRGDELQTCWEFVRNLSSKEGRLETEIRGAMANRMECNS